MHIFIYINNNRHGEGKYVLLDSTIKRGIWEDGRRIKWIDEDGNDKLSDEDDNN